jgi:cytochrome P450
LTCRASPQARCATGPTKNILGLDGEQYHRLRRLVAQELARGDLVSKAFAPRAAERLRTQTLEIITELVDPLTTAGHSDVLANTASANRDPAVYDNPDCLYITREGPAAMLTFGDGLHYCLGSNLARLELTEALRVITRRMPNPRRTGPAP